MAELDVAYANGDFIADAQSFPPRWAAQAAAFRAERVSAGRAELDVPYGRSERQRYDLFLPESAPSGVMVFVHGGYWLRFDKSSWSHLAAGAVARGWAVAMPSYDLCPEVRIADITRQVCVAIAAVAAHVNGPMTLAGHSAGGHLVARMLAPDMLPEDVRARITHVVPISPLSDLRPLLRTSMNDAFAMDAAQAGAESPIAQPAPEVPVTVLVGAHERPAFLDQAGWLGAAWGCETILAPERHHFDVIDCLADAESGILERLTAQS